MTTSETNKFRKPSCDLQMNEGDVPADGLTNYPLLSQWEEEVSKFEYHFAHGLRYVLPYKFNFIVNVKRRWVGRNLVDVFFAEFPYYPRNYYEGAVKAGRLTVNNKRASLNYTLQDGDKVGHLVHRHEPPVTGQPIKIIARDENVVVVDKPASIPVHPCGRYRRNTLLAILAKEQGFFDLHTVHRLDRLTSGVVVLARTREAADALRLQIQERELGKEYYARVIGRFPELPPQTKDSESTGDGEAGMIVVDQPVRNVSQRLGICDCSPLGKASKTLFKRISYHNPSDTSVVSCRPLTGRTHQIRVHLQYLSHPIANDPLYCPADRLLPDSTVYSVTGSTAPSVSGATYWNRVDWEGRHSAGAVAARLRDVSRANVRDETIQGIRQEEEIFSSMNVVGPTKVSNNSIPSSPSLKKRRTEAIAPTSTSSVPPLLQADVACASEVRAVSTANFGTSSDVLSGEKEEALKIEPSVPQSNVILADYEFDDLCPHCEANRRAGHGVFYVPPKVHNDDFGSLGIWLHAREYGCDQWNYMTDVPLWALEEFPGWITAL
eukprot:CAMPEP_0184646674 /NCGR_PEP_ID=MMETSP0308-20130426/3415_1 /TAXON_ID=38269 /ORGANISM="Gloeochaete witrockiana, Strain SAG 46.84" /LENGTH=549 /DNA_ID=CAMNT_0027076915 /DNA_START=569 /DNA_END=2218 /DNA_ORIENTATION=+